MCSEDCLKQISNAINAVTNATTKKSLMLLTGDALNLVEEKFVAKQITAKHKFRFERCIRSKYRKQLIEEST